MDQITKCEPIHWSSADIDRLGGGWSKRCGRGLLVIAAIYFVYYTADVTTIYMDDRHRIIMYMHVDPPGIEHACMYTTHASNICSSKRC
eukprot:scaffold121971_cov15-Prasinocladus_malaysianus.AAC.1